MAHSNGTLFYRRASRLAAKHCKLLISTGGGSVKLKGRNGNASIACNVHQMGTKKLGGHFMLSFSHNDVVEEVTNEIPYNATNDEMKRILEELDSIDTVTVHSESLDTNGTANGAFQWHVTFSSLRNAGDVPLLTAETSNLEGSNASIHIVESRKGSSLAVQKIVMPANATSFWVALMV